VENDIGFINLGIPAYLLRVGDEVEPRAATMLLAFYDAVPQSLRGRLTWHPGARLRELTKTGANRKASQEPTRRRFGAGDVANWR
jgi:hypothetical protein